MKSLDISEFVLEKAVFEVRYPNAYLLWDHSGSIWTQANRIWSSLRPAHVEPNNTEFTIANKVHLKVTLEAASVIAKNPKRSLEDFIDLADAFVGLVKDNLEIAEYSRVALRVIYFKEFRDHDEAAEALFSTNLMRVPDGDLFGVRGRLRTPEYAVRNQNDEIGYTLRIKAQGRKIDFIPPLDFDGMEPFHKERYGLVFDVDYFTTAPVAISQFRASDWINQTNHLIKKDSAAYLGGA